MIFDSIHGEFGVRPASILHIGANIGQEAAAYQENGLRGYHVEAMPRAYEELKRNCQPHRDQFAISACLDAEPGKKVTFNVSSNSQSSSYLPIGRHALAYPNIRYVDEIELETTTLDTLVEQGAIPRDINFAVIDVQGAEARVLAGATQFLTSDSLWGLLVEVSLDPLYEGGASFHEVYANQLLPHGFYLRRAFFNNLGWSDAMFLKRWWQIDENETTPLASYKPAAGS